MLIVMKPDYKKEELDALMDTIRNHGLNPHAIPGKNRTAIGITGNKGAVDKNLFDGLPGVKECITVTKPFKLSGRDFKKEDTLIKVKDVVFGGDNFVIMAGPCAIESEEQTLRIAHKVKESGANVLRGGAYKPRTSPYSFQGLGLEGLKILKKASEETGLPVITEALSLESLEEVYEYSDIIQIGARNMQNFKLLEEAGKMNKPVLLKRGLSATIDEWLGATEYLMENGNKEVILCERGLRSFDKYTRNLLDISAVPVIKDLSHLPVVIDPSHSTGRKDSVLPMSYAAAAAGAHAILVDVHDRPHEALCDGPQAISPEEFDHMVRKLRKIQDALAN